MKVYKLFHNLSLDIVLGAIGSSCLAARLFKSNPGWAWWLTLALTVWLLYMGDHILDAWKHRKDSKRELHLFIFRNRKILLWFMGVLGISDSFLILNFLDRSLLKYALLLALMVFVFYSMRHLFRRNRIMFIPGELFVLLFYLSGTWLGPLVAREEALLTSDAMIAVMFSGVLLMNLGIISVYDIRLDARLGITSMAQYFGKNTTRNIIIITGMGIYLLAIIQFLVSGTDRYTQFALIIAGMVTILFSVLFLPGYFTRRDQFRKVSDAVFYMGFLTLLINV